MSVVKAEQDLANLRLEIDKTRARLTEMEEQATKIAHFIEMSNVYSPSAYALEISSGGRIAPNGVFRPRLNGEPPKNVRVVVDILRERGRPIKTKDLVDELERRGITTGGKIPVTNLSSALSRFKQLLSADRSEGWSLNEWSVPQIANNGEPKPADAKITSDTASELSQVEVSPDPQSQDG
jgi:hypothetical protein